MNNTMNLLLRYQAAVVSKEKYNQHFRLDVYLKCIVQYLIPNSITGTKLISPPEYFDEILLEKRLNNYKVGIIFDKYQIMRVK